MSLPFRKRQKHSPTNETVEIVTLEDLFKFFADSKQRIKEKKRDNIDFDLYADGSNDGNGGINADDYIDGSDEVEVNVRVDDSDDDDCRS